MTIQEFVGRFPEIPQDLHGEPLLAQYAEAFGDQLRIAKNPGACSAQHEAANHYYLKLVGPIRLYWYKLSTREKVLKQLQELLDQHRADPAGFVASLVPGEVAESEVKGPGCS
ncbi:MAG: hypothetical protein ACE10F_04215 [Candidatus Methylomirabilales bacterium]|jgi:hypothetical protein|nr:hypothetical protein [candidate division NC10 bacterium]MCZ6549940.1 hypothetical protein [candidate division NC10 bacterium]MEC4669983.1 hypothetical protein [Nitrospirota bacterium]MEC4687776.1 hypothetical protein [Nitrospirota bacterium]